MTRFRIPTLPPLTAYLASPVFVALLACILWIIQTTIAHVEGGHVRPFGVGLLLAVALMTMLGGRGPGLLTLALSSVVLMFVLTPLGAGGVIGRPRDWVELFFLLCIGVFLVRGLEAVRTNAHLLAQSEEAQARLRAVVDTAPVGVMLSDMTGHLTYANREAERIWGRPLAKVGMEGWVRYRMFNSDGTVTAPEQTGLARVLAGEETMVQDERLIEQPDGTRIAVSAASTLVRDDEGHVLNGLVVFSDITERRRAEEEIKQLLADVQARAERESLINRIGQVQRRSLDPDWVQREAVHALGAALGADRCYFTLFELEQDHAWIGADWHQESLDSLAGEYAISERGISLDDLYRPGETVVVEDRQQADVPPRVSAALELLGIRSGIVVPLYSSGRLAAALSVVMVGTVRAWTSEQIALVEAVAVQTRAAVEAARLQQREHMIAVSLQNALMPAMPKTVSGLAMSSYYKAALVEASVGGDFIDVFSLDSARIVFAVGDLSGKGLAAAAQVATVRNMLRYSLYRNAGLSAALAELNATIVRHELLSGFATLFIGVYETAPRRLTYASCGHDPGLLRRAATGQIELLPEEGTRISPVLGLAEESAFLEQETTLAAGDAMLLCTDGVTEAGRSRGEFLGVAGVAEMLRAGPDGETVEELVARLVAEVRIYARGIQHDDICILGAITGEA